MVNVTFNVTDASGNEIYSRLYISPYQTPFAYSSSIIGNDAVIAFENGKAVTASLVPATYSVRAMGINTNSEFLITLPSGIDGQTVNANEYIISSPQMASYTASYAITAGTANLALGLPDVTDLVASHSIGINQPSPKYTLDVNGIIANSAGDLSIQPSSNNIILGLNGEVSVGIGTDDPQGSLDVNGQITNGGTDGVFNFASFTNANSWVCFGNAGYFGIQTNDPQYNLDVHGPSGGSTIGNSSDNLILDAALGTKAILMQINGGGNVGIGQDNPQYTLDITGNLGNSNSDDYFIGAGGTDSYLNAANGGGVGIGTPNPNYILDVNGPMGNSNGGDYLLNTGGSNSWVNANGGYFGVGNPSPGYTLDIGIDGTIGTSTGQLVLSMTGDSLGGANLYLYNRGGANGAIFENPDDGELDFGFLTSHGTDYQNNIRLEQRSYVKVSANNPSNGGYGEFQFIQAETPSYYFCIGLNGGVVYPDLGFGGNTSPSYPVDVTGDINFSGNLRKAGSVYVPASASYAVSASYVSGPVIATSMQLPYSSSAHSLTPTAATGSAYFQVSGSTNLLYVYTGTRWASSSLA